MLVGVAVVSQGKMEFKAVQCVTDVPHMVRYHWWSMLVLLNERYKMAASLGYENLRFGLVSVLDLEGFGLKSMGKQKREGGRDTHGHHTEDRQTGLVLPAPGQLGGRAHVRRRGQAGELLPMLMLVACRGVMDRAPRGAQPERSTLTSRRWGAASRLAGLIHPQRHRSPS